MEILAALPEDCRSIAEVHVQSWRAAYGGVLDAAFLSGLSVDHREVSWRQVLSEGKSELLVGTEAGSVIGFSSFGPSRDSDAPPHRGELWALYIRPDTWSTGAGRELWQATRARLRSKGFSSMSLWVLERNTRAIRFYSTAGFVAEPGSEKEFELGGTKVRELRMVHAS
jgi:ribosomal protein S18 acetylase RimI-like enzyme